VPPSEITNRDKMGENNSPQQFALEEHVVWSRAIRCIFCFQRKVSAASLAKGCRCYPSHKATTLLFVPTIESYCFFYFYFCANDWNGNPFQ